MWNYQNQATTTAQPERLYHHWSHVATWPEWNQDLRRTLRSLRHEQHH